MVHLPGWRAWWCNQSFLLSKRRTSELASLDCILTIWVLVLPIHIFVYNSLINVLRWQRVHLSPYRVAKVLRVFPLRRSLWVSPGIILLFPRIPPRKSFFHLRISPWVTLVPVFEGVSWLLTDTKWVFSFVIRVSYFPRILSRVITGLLVGGFDWLFVRNLVILVN